MNTREESWAPCSLEPAFPLTPALSPGESEMTLAPGSELGAISKLEARRSWPPPPEEEGWDEGARSARSAKRFRFVNALQVLVMVLAFGQLGAFAQDEFTALFNGRDLAGWVPVNVASNTFTARDGIIVSTGKPTGIMRTDRMYENFILELEWKHVHPKGNAGLFIWSEPMTAPGTPFAMTLAVNGKVVSGASNSSVRKGYLCLESEGSECHFRNLRLAELPSSNPPAEQIATEAKPWRSLYCGVDLSGWKIVRGKSGQWQVKDWILEADGREGETMIATTDQWYDCVLQLDWRKLDPEAVLEFVPAKADNTNLAVKFETNTTPLGPSDWNRTVVVFKGGVANLFSMLKHNGSTGDTAAVTHGFGVGPMHLSVSGGRVQLANVFEDTRASSTYDGSEAGGGRR